MLGAPPPAKRTGAYLGYYHPGIIYGRVKGIVIVWLRGSRGRPSRTYHIHRLGDRRARPSASARFSLRRCQVLHFVIVFLLRAITHSVAPVIIAPRMKLITGSLQSDKVGKNRGKRLNLEKHFHFCRRQK